MNNKRMLVAIVPIGLLFAVGAVVLVTSGLPAINAKQQELAQAQGTTTQFEDLLMRAPAVADRLRDSFAVGLGATPDEIAHTLRNSLRETAEQASLREVTVTTGDLVDVKSPAIRAVSRGSFRPLSQQLRASPDFWTVSGRIDGTGSIAEAHAAVVRLEAQPWITRVIGISIRRGQDSSGSLRISIDTLSTVAPDVAPRETSLVMNSPSEETLAVGQELESMYLFTAPPEVKPPPPVIVRQPETPKVVVPPYADWKFTGVVSGREAVAYFQNTKTGETIGLPPGGTLLDVQFAEVVDGTARFRFEERDFRILVGETLADRQAEDAVDSPVQSGSDDRGRSGA